MTVAITGLRASERIHLGGMGAAVLALNLAGWGLFAFAMSSGTVAKLGLGIGLAVTAWTLGMRHAFDADHISAIDNTTRKLMSEKQRPLSTGFFFALGHSSIVVAVGLGIVVAANFVFKDLLDPHSAYKSYGGLIGTIIAVTFLYLVAALNLVGLAGMGKVVRSIRAGGFDENELERLLESRGFLSRLFRPLMRTIRKPGQMYIVGVLFGVGFDTSTEVALLTTTATNASVGMPWYAVLALPLLFAGGMTLFDTLDGCFMNFAYGWAFARPARKVYYNIAITALSVAMALLVGSVELVGLLSDQLRLTHSLWRQLASVDLNTLGFGIVGAFVLAWAAAVAVWKLGGFEQRWEKRAARTATGA
jgi:high-affinity nickel-transport protein